MNFDTRRYRAMALDPIHIGTGEFRLGRVDNTIVREPGTNLPKIPGSSIAGVARAYTAMHHRKYRREDGKSCAGKGGDRGTDHCGSNCCPVCTTYGFSRDKSSFQGLAQFSDARLLFFPVYTLAGPMWVTSPSALVDAGFGDGWLEWVARLETGGPSYLSLSGARALPERLNFGWVYLPVYVGRETPPPLAGIPKTVASSLALVSDSMFSVIVDDQLEVRTSVSISPETGTAEDKALFTSEAIPRATLLHFAVICLDPANFRVPTGQGPKPVRTPDDSRDAGIDDVAGWVWDGLALAEALGIGGVNTRGMGRLRIEPVAQEQRS